MRLVAAVALLFALTGCTDITTYYVGSCILYDINLETGEVTVDTVPAGQVTWADTACWQGLLDSVAAIEGRK